MVALPLCRFIAAATTAIVLFAFPSVIDAQGASPGSGRAIRTETEGTNRREITTSGPQAPDVPAISFIDSPTATCYQPDAAQDVCYVNWYYMSVGASPNYMIWMWVEIGELGKVARYSGFFQTSMYVPYNMHDRGFKVACGALGNGGDPDFGNAYAYTIRAHDSAALESSNYGTVYCPAFVP